MLVNTKTGETILTNNMKVGEIITIPRGEYEIVHSLEALKLMGKFSRDGRFMSTSTD